MRAEAAPAAPQALPRWLLLGNVLVAALLAALVALVLSASLDGYRQRALDAAATLARSLQHTIAADIGRIDVVLQSIVADHERDAGDGVIEPGLLARLLEQQEPLLPEIEGLRVTDAAGTVLHGRGLQPGQAQSVAGQSFFTQAMTTQGLVVSEPYASPLGGRWEVALARRLRNPDGSFGGVVYASVPVVYFQRLLAAVDVGPQGASVVRSSTLRLIARHAAQGDPGAGIGTTNVAPEMRAALQRAPAGGSFIARSPLDRVERASAFQRVGAYPMLVLVGLASDDFTGPWQREAAAVAGLAGLAVVAMALSSLAIYRAWKRDRASRSALEREVQMQHAIMRTASDGIHVLDRRGRVVQCSDSFAAMLGYAPAEMPGMTVDVWDPRHADPAWRRDRFESFEAGRSYRFTTRHRRKDGGLFDVEVLAVGARIGDEDFLYCASRDVSERERATRALRASEALLDRTGRVAGIGGWQLDLATGELTWSAQMRRLLEVDGDYRPGADDAQRFYEPEAQPLAAAAMQSALADGRPWDLELPLVTARGRRLWVRSVGEVDVESGRPVRLVGALQDITERRLRRAELELERERRAETERHAAELDTLLKERSEMLDVMAHEVRQPLNNASAALQSMAHLLPGSVDDGTAQRLRRAQNVMGQVLASIDNTLAGAALLARTEPVERQDTDIDTLLAVAIGDMPQADRGRIWLRRDTTARTAWMDMSLMRLALRNLLSNALKYSPPGAPVRMTLSESEEPLGIVIDVADSGPGVDPGLLPRLFERGARNPQPNAPPGHGLGLYIVRRVMELHGGRVSLIRNGPDGVTMRLVLVEAPDES